jgi:hypothetical protein
MPTDSRHESPMSIMPAPNCHVAALLAISIVHPKRIKLLVGVYALEGVRNPVCDEACHTPFTRLSGYRIKIFVRPDPCQYSGTTTTRRGGIAAHHLSFPSANADFGWSTLRCGRSNTGIVALRSSKASNQCQWQCDNLFGPYRYGSCHAFVPLLSHREDNAAGLGWYTIPAGVVLCCTIR